MSYMYIYITWEPSLVVSPPELFFSDLILIFSLFGSLSKFFSRVVPVYASPVYLPILHGSPKPLVSVTIGSFLVKVI